MSKTQSVAAMMEEEPTRYSCSKMTINNYFEKDIIIRSTVYVAL